MSLLFVCRVLCIRSVGLRAEWALRQVARHCVPPRRRARLLHVRALQDSRRATAVTCTRVRAAFGLPAQSKALDNEQLLCTALSLSTVGLARSVGIFCPRTASTPRLRGRADLPSTKSLRSAGAVLVSALHCDALVLKWTIQLHAVSCLCCSCIGRWRSAALCSSIY